MKLISVVLSLLVLSGCCSLKFPLDGKAQSWCRAKKLATEYCDREPDLYIPHVMVDCRVEEKK